VARRRLMIQLRRALPTSRRRCSMPGRFDEAHTPATASSRPHRLRSRATSRPSRSCSERTEPCCASDARRSRPASRRS
jgi:hypothetical protein